MADSPTEKGAQVVVRHTSDQEAESHLSSLVYETSHQVQMAMESMLKMINEIDQNSLNVKEEIEKSRESAMEKKRALEQEKERFQKAAFTVLDMLGNQG